MQFGLFACNSRLHEKACDYLLIIIGQSRIKADQECCSVRTGLKHNWVLTSH